MGEKMKFLIVNADDFGADQQTNDRIMAAVENEVVTSVSLMAGGSAFESAIKSLKSLPKIGVGVHLTLVDGNPVLPRNEVASLVDDEGKFLPGYGAFFQRWLNGRIHLEEVEKEWYSQIERIVQNGIRPTHLDGHQHLHIFPPFLPILIRLAQAFEIRLCRVPTESMLHFPAWYGLGRLIGRTGLSGISGAAKNRLRQYDIHFPDHFWGMLSGGQIRAAAFQKMLRAMGPGVNELMCHPGVGGEEWQVLTDPSTVRLIEEQGLIPANFSVIRRESGARRRET